MASELAFTGEVWDIVLPVILDFFTGSHFLRSTSVGLGLEVEHLYYLFMQAYYNTPDFLYGVASASLTTVASILYKPPLIVGGFRPVNIQLPDNYDPTVPAPLLILVHGLGSSGKIQDAYEGTGAYAKANGIVYLAPNGYYDPIKLRFWNATQACCDFFYTGVDDHSYLMSLVAETQALVSIDPKRIYFTGHSNGGFMSHALACDYSDTIAAIVSLSGATYYFQSDC